jgi:hypothetical protein
LNLVGWHAYHDERAANRKRGHKPPYGITTGCWCENCYGPAQTLRYGCCIVYGSIDVDVSAQIFRKLFLVASTSDCDSAKSHVPRKLDTKTPETPDTLYSDEISGRKPAF